MIGRLIVAAMCLVLAVVAIFAQLDQQSRLAPHYALMIPDAFSGNAARERSKMALVTGQADVALAEAQTQVALRPMPAESLTVLALAAVAAGEESVAREALGAASRRGWREPVSQLASAQAAVEQGEYAIASQRIVALLSTGNLREPALDLLSQLLEHPEGREQFADRLAAFGRWQANALSPIYGATDPAAWAQTLALAQDRGAQLNCSQLARLAEAYRRDGLDEDRARFWPGNCSES